MQLNSGLERIPLSGIRKIFDLATDLAAQGRKLIRMDVGRPAFPPPSFVVDAVSQALLAGQTVYTPNRGIAPLRNALASKLLTDSGAEYDPDDEIITTCGASEAVAVAMLAVLEPGAEVLVPEPAWPHYVACARLAGAVPVTVNSDPASGFQLSAELLERQVTSRTRMIILNSPSNPTGAVQSAEALRDVLEVARKHDLIVASDEIYEHFVFDGEHVSFVSLPGARERTIHIGGFSKSYAMTGWRLGYMAAPKAISLELNKVHQYLTVCANSFAQAGAVAALEHPSASDFLSKVKTSFKALRDQLCEGVRGIPGIELAIPGGAFYAFARFPGWNEGSQALALDLLDNKGIATIPGEVFGKGYDDCLRLSYGSCTPQELSSGLQGLAEYMEGRR